jgi:hypothetical protein
MGPSTNTDTTNRTFGTPRKNVVVMVCVLGLVTYSLVSNGYSSMLAYVPESQLSFADVPVVNNITDQIQTNSLSSNSENDNKPLLATTEAHMLTVPKTTNRETPESPYDDSDDIIVPNRTVMFMKHPEFEGQDA